jgi:hypothetical protein
MEVILPGTPHVVFPMGDASRVGEARRHAAQPAAGLALDDTTAGKLALVVTELGNNLVRHACGGRLLIAARQQDQPEVEVLALDDGPESPIRRARSPTGSRPAAPGHGPGRRAPAGQRFRPALRAGRGHRAPDARAFVGTAPPRAAFHCGAVMFCAPGEQVCGDAWALALDGAQAALLSAAGLGHGPQAAEASQAAVAQFARAPFDGLALQLDRMHGGLRITRAAAATLALLAGASMQMAGAGNVSARLLSGTHNKSFAAQHGTLSLQVRRFSPVGTEWPPHAVAVLHSDGLQSRWASEPLAPLVARDPSLLAAWLVRDNLRGCDDVTVLVVQRNADGR